MRNHIKGAKIFKEHFAPAKNSFLIATQYFDFEFGADCWPTPVPEMNSSASNVVCVIVLLTASAVSSSFSPSACLGRKSFGAIAPAAAGSIALTPRVTSPVATTLAMSGGDLEGATSISNSKLGPNATPPGFLRRLFSSFPWHVLPNYLTYARCLAIPLFMILSYYPVRFPNRALVLSIVFALASFTDWLDGFLARRWDITSPFGAFLDPVADKLMVSTALIILAGRYGGIVAIPTSIIMAREVSVSALREWMAQQGKRDAVKVGMQVGSTKKYYRQAY